MTIARARSQRFVNWAGTVTTSPLRWHEPHSESELQDLVRNAARERKTVRVVGAGHSWSALAAPTELAVSLTRMQGMLSVSPDRNTVTAHAGTRLRDFNDALAREGLALPIVGSIAEQALAGITATGTHGSSLQHGNLSSFLTAMRLVQGDGSVLSLDESDPRFAGARVHLGALGLLTQVTLRVVPAFSLRESVENLPIEEVSRSLETIAASAEYVKVWWLPYAPLAQVFRYERTTQPPPPWPAPEFERLLDERVVNGAAFPLLLGLGAKRPRWIPAIHRLVARSYLSRPPRVGRSDRVLGVAMPPVHRETEAVVPMKHSGEALDRLRRLLAREELPVNFPVEARFVRGDFGWLSPAYGGDVCQLGAYMAEAPGIERYFSLFWKELREMNARPHWGKEFDHSREELRALYPHFDAFVSLRNALDPERTFASPLHTRILGR